MNTEITQLKADIKIYEAQVKLYQSWLNNAKKHLQALQKQVDDTVVDGLRMKVREFIDTGRQTIVPISLRLSPSEYKRFMEMRVSQELSAQALVRQSLRVYDMYLAGYLVDNSPKFGGCSACE